MQRIELIKELDELVKAAEQTDDPLTEDIRRTLYTVLGAAYAAEDRRLAEFIAPFNTKLLEEMRAELAGNSSVH